MLHRLGVIDLSIGNLNTGILKTKSKQLMVHQTYQTMKTVEIAPISYCGIDIVDILSRH